MQLLYGNDGKQYRVLARTAGIDAATEKALLGGYLGYFFVPDEGLYSSAADQPVSLTYVTTNLEGLLDHDMVLLCRNARMTNYTTPSSYAHFILQEKEREGYGEGFFRLLGYPFIRDADAVRTLDAMLQADCPAPLPRQEVEEVDPGQLKAIIGLLFTMYHSSSPLRILSDRGGDVYNARSLDILEAVYRHLPQGLRRSYGFCSYAVPEQRLSARVKVVVMDPGCVTVRMPEVLDLADPGLKRMYRQISPDIRRYVDMLFEMQEEEREQYFAGIEQSLGGKSLAAEDYVDLYPGSVCLSVASAENGLPEDERTGEESSCPTRAQILEAIDLAVEKALCRRIQWLREYRELTCFTICPDFAAQAGAQIGLLRDRTLKVWEREPVIELSSAKDNRTKRSCPMELFRLAGLLDFLREPREEALKDCRKILKTNHWIVYDLMRTGNVSSGHFWLLISLEKDNVEYVARMVEALFSCCDIHRLDPALLAARLAGEYSIKSRRELAELLRERKGKKEKQAIDCRKETTAERSLTDPVREVAFQAFLKAFEAQTGKRCRHPTLKNVRFKKV